MEREREQSSSDWLTGKSYFVLMTLIDLLLMMRQGDSPEEIPVREPHPVWTNQE